MLDFISPLFAKAGIAALVACLILIITMHFLRKVIKNVEMRIFISLAISYFASLVFYSFSFKQWVAEATQVINYFLETIGWMFLAPASFIIILIVAAYFLEKKLTAQEFRTFWHILGGLLILIFTIFNRELGFLITSYTILGFLVMEYLRKLPEESLFTNFVKKSFHKAIRDNEIASFMASIFFLTGCWIIIYMFAKTPAIVLLLILTLGDASAVITGKKLGRDKLKYNLHKSIQGSTAMFLIIMVILLAFKFNLIFAFIVAIVVALLESLPLNMSDNLIIPVASIMLFIGITNAIQYFNFWLYIFPIALFFIVYLPKLLDLKSSLVVFLFGALVLNGLINSLAYFFIISTFLIINALAWNAKRIRKCLKIKENVWKTRTINTVIASGMIPALIAVLGNVYLLTGAISAALAETMANKIGSFYPHPRLITNMKKKKPGTRGAVSWYGYVAALMACLITGLIIVITTQIFGIKTAFWPIFAIAIIAGLGAITLNSLMGIVLGYLAKEEIDVISTLLGVAIAAALMLI